MSTTWLPALGAESLQILPAGFTIPSIVYVAPVTVGLLFVIWLLYTVRPPITDSTVMAFTPWIATGSVLHVLYQQPAFFKVVRPFFGTPMVYLTTAILAGAVWFFAEVIAQMRDERASVDRLLAFVGTGVLITFTAFSLYIGSELGTIRPFFPVIGIALSAMGAGFAWIGLSLTFTESAAVTGRTGAIVVFAHVLDGVSTAIGVDFMGVGERTPMSRIILEYSAQLPTAEVIGVGWLFLLVKLLLALFIVVAFREYVESSPAQARLVLLLVAALGLGPGAHNMLLFTVMESVVAA